MLIHLSPQLLLAKPADKCELLKITSAELGIQLIGGVDVVGRRPFPNKRYAVACRREGGRPVHGLLVQADGHISEFSVTTEWKLPDGLILTHSVRYVVLDEDFDAITENMLAWYVKCGRDGETVSRWPQDSVYTSPASSQPRMDVVTDSGRSGVITDSVSSNGRLVARQEIFRLHTVPRVSVMKPEFSKGSRMPFLSEAFHAKLTVN